jgi:hypothetical protein
MVGVPGVKFHWTTRPVIKGCNYPALQAKAEVALNGPMCRFDPDRGNNYYKG